MKNKTEFDTMGNIDNMGELKTINEKQDISTKDDSNCDDKNTYTATRRNLKYYLKIDIRKCFERRR